MIIGKENKYVFVSTPKSGTHSLYALLKEKFGGVHLGVLRDPEKGEKLYHLKNIPQEFADFLSFTCVRHPFIRTVCCWWELTRQDFYKNIYIPIIGGTDFPRFVDWVTTKEIADVPGRGMLLTVTQSEWHGKNEYDVVLKLNSLEPDFNSLPFVKEHVQVPHLLRRGEGREPWQSYYTPELREKVYNWATEDFQRFGFSQELIENDEGEN